MGLDWLPGNRPRPGYEAEFEELFHRLKSAAGGPSDRDRFEEISESAFDTLGAPTVGVDRVADVWALQMRVELERSEPAEEFLRDLEGFRVLALVPPCDGLPAYSHGECGGYVEPYSFRGEFLRYSADEIGPELVERAYTSMLPAELLEYGRTLLATAGSLAARNGLDPDALTVPEFALDAPGSAEFSTEFKVDMLRAAGRWCVFWAERGHFLDVYA